MCSPVTASSGKSCHTAVNVHTSIYHSMTLKTSSPFRRLVSCYILSTMSLFDGRRKWSGRVCVRQYNERDLETHIQDAYNAETPSSVVVTLKSCLQLFIRLQFVGWDPSRGFALPRIFTVRVFAGQLSVDLCRLCSSFVLLTNRFSLSEWKFLKLIVMPELVAVVGSGPLNVIYIPQFHPIVPPTDIWSTSIGFSST